jgi:hypothetical protein
VLLVLSGLLPGFFAGVVAGKTLFATSLNEGLLNAFSSVGQNLLGEGAFGASAIPGNPVAPSGGVQMEVSRDAILPVSMDIFIPGNPVLPGDPCRRAAQVSVSNGQVTVSYDQTLFNADNFKVNNINAIPGNPIMPAVCPAQAPSN